MRGFKKKYINLYIFQLLTDFDCRVYIFKTANLVDVIEGRRNCQLVRCTGA